MPTFGWYLVGVAATAFVLIMIVAFTIQIADTPNPQKAPFKIIRIASFFGFLAAGLVIVLVFLGLPDVNKGEPATSLEPGVYGIFGLGGTSDELNIAYLDDGKARLVTVRVEDLDPATQIKPEQAGGRTHQVTYVTRCAQKNVCETRILILPLSDQP